MSVRPVRLAQALGLMTANLLAATCAHAQDEPSNPATVVSDTESDLGLTRIDSAILFYHEAGGRVRATEPVVSVVMNGSDGAILSARLTSDILTGATPNGATPWTGVQTFLTPAHAPGITTVTQTSGGSKLVTIPGTGTVARQYQTAAGVLPVDTGFQDKRKAIDLGYSALLGPDTRISFGGSASTERDYRSYSGSMGISRDFNSKNTTLSLNANYESDQSKPFFGTPTPLSEMSAEPKGPAESKSVTSLVLGVTQVVSRHWLTQLNYNVGTTQGYQNDPYRIISVVDPVTGAPLKYLYDSRPRSRLRQSVYWGNKIALGPTVADIALRGYHDSWGINSVTAELSERIPITSWLYVEPQARYYHQSAANFFHNYLVGGQPLPTNASSDSRLDRFSATTVGLKVGIPLVAPNDMGPTRNSEFYLQVQAYQQTGTNHPAGAIGALAHENLFAGTKATSVIVGYTFAFY